MTGSSSVVLSNLAYLIGAVVLAIIGGLAVWLHHRQPKSIDANVDAFQRGLQAIAPDSSRPGPLRPPPATPEGAVRVRPRSVVTVQTAPTNAAPSGARAVTGRAESADSTDEAAAPEGDRGRTDGSAAQTAAGDGAGDRAGADTG
jgi:hypothetical protein